MKRPSFATDQFYHIYNRGVEKRKVFTDTPDYRRFLFGLFIYNSQDSIENVSYYLANTEVEPPYKTKELVEISAFALMPNHYHLLLRQKIDGGIVNFMQKLGTGYTMYFNQRHKRVGPLFQGKFKAALVEENRHFLYLPFYIHLNPLDLFMPEWRKGKIRNHKKALEFLHNYRWSSFSNYLGSPHSLATKAKAIETDFLDSFYGGKENHRREFLDFLSEMDLGPISELLLE